MAALLIRPRKVTQVHIYTASGMTAAVVEVEEVEEQGWGDDVDILLEDGESPCPLLHTV